MGGMVKQMGSLANVAGGKMEQEMKRNPQAMMKNL